MLPAIFPDVEIVPRAPRVGRRETVESLCREAHIDCRVTGPSAGRVVYIRRASKFEIFREPGSLGVVSMGVPKDDVRERAVLVLGALAYAVFDYAARESMRGRPESKPCLPVGRPRQALVLSGAERQRRWRERQSKTR